MNIISIIVKEVKQNLRDKKAMTMMVLFPVLLIVVLGAAFNTSFSSNLKIETPKVFYSIEAKGPSADYLKEFINHKTVPKIEYIKTNDVKKAKELLISSSEYSGVIEMKQDNKIELFKNDKGDMNLKGGILEGMLSGFVNQFNIIVEVQKVNPKALPEILSDTNADYTKISSINKAKKPSSLDYYAVAEIALIIMYGAMTGLYGISSEKNSKTRDRILSSPVKKYEFLVGKTVGGVLITMIQIMIVVLFSKYVLNADWGTDIFTVMLILTSQIIMAISLGVGLGFIFKQVTVAGGVLNFLIPVIVFLGGSYGPVDRMSSGKTFQMITYFSPVRWVNKSIFEVIYSNDYSKVLPAILINILIAIVFLTISSLSFRKETI